MIACRHESWNFLCSSSKFCRSRLGHFTGAHPLKKKKIERYVLVPHIQEQIHHERVSEIVMEQIVGVSVSQQLHDEIVLIRRVYKEWKPDKCADVPALLMRCAGMERLTYVWVPGSIKSIPMFLWCACSFASQNN